MPFSPPDPFPAAIGFQSSTIASSGQTFPVTFHVSGLPPESNWNLSISGSSFGTNQTLLTIYEPNGSFRYSAFAPVAHSSGSPASGYLNGTFAVAGQAVSVVLPWSWIPNGGPVSNPSQTSAPFGPTGLPGVLFVGILLTLVAAIIVGSTAWSSKAKSRAMGPVLKPGPEPSRPGTGPTVPNESPDADPLGHML